MHKFMNRHQSHVLRTPRWLKLLVVIVVLLVHVGVITFLLRGSHWPWSALATTALKA